MENVQFGPYTLVKRLGKGGMAEVFLARMKVSGGYEKKIAIKRLLGPMNTDKHLVSMLTDEARLSVWLHHPNILQVLDFGKVDSLYYIAMEYVDGCDLSTLIKHYQRHQKPMPLQMALYIGLQVYEALSYAHNRRNAKNEPLRIIHRDVSPHNILLSKEGQVKLADFGLARATISLHESQSGVIRGKFSYMPKEQAYGHDIDHRVDIFAAGVSLYQMLSGKKPYNSESLAQQLYQLEQPIALPSSLHSDVPQAVDAIVMKVIQPNREKRYSSASLVAKDIRDILLHLSTPNQEMQALAGITREISNQTQSNEITNIGIMVSDVSHHGMLKDKKLAKEHIASSISNQQTAMVMQPNPERVNSLRSDTVSTSPVILADFQVPRVSLIQEELDRVRASLEDSVDGSVDRHSLLSTALARTKRRESSHHPAQINKEVISTRADTRVQLGITHDLPPFPAKAADKNYDYESDELKSDAKSVPSIISIASAMLEKAPGQRNIVDRKGLIQTTDIGDQSIRGNRISSGVLDSVVIEDNLTQNELQKRHYKASNDSLEPGIPTKTGQKLQKAIDAVVARDNRDVVDEARSEVVHAHKSLSEIEGSLLDASKDDLLQSVLKLKWSASDDDITKPLILEKDRPVDNSNWFQISMITLVLLMFSSMIYMWFRMHQKTEISSDSLSPALIHESERPADRQQESPNVSSAYRVGNLPPPDISQRVAESKSGSDNSVSPWPDTIHSIPKATPIEVKKNDGLLVSDEQGIEPNREDSLISEKQHRRTRKKPARHVQQKKIPSGLDNEDAISVYDVRQASDNKSSETPGARAREPRDTSSTRSTIPKGELEIRSSSPAEVYINNRIVGTTPIRLRLKPGVYHVWVNYLKNGERSSVRRITVHSSHLSRVVF